jgi:hypothetical protein
MGGDRGTEAEKDSGACWIEKGARIAASLAKRNALSATCSSTATRTWSVGAGV